MRYRDTSRAVTAVAAAALVLAGCSDAGTDGKAGWVGGEPQWHAEPDKDWEVWGGDRPVEAASDTVEQAAGVGGPDPALSPLRAGNVDDNVDHAAFIQYLDRLQETVSTRPFDASGRIVVDVNGTDGLGVPGQLVAVSAGGDEVASIRTTADGTARFWPGLYETRAAEYSFSTGSQTVSGQPGEQVSIDLERSGGREGPLAVDVHFLLDTTGSMGDEIDQLKTTIDTVAGRIAELEGSPRARFGMTVYRDLEDTYVTSTYRLTGDLPAFRTALSQVEADGGGDYPEALDEGLAAAVAEPGWGDPESTVQLVFLVADAPPQVTRQVERTYPQSVTDAIGAGMKIFPIASSESDDQAEAVFRQVAAATGARFVFLSYGTGGAATGAQTDIDRTDYEELSLDDLVVRLVAEELAALGGTDVVVPGPTPSPAPSTPADQ